MSHTAPALRAKKRASGFAFPAAWGMLSRLRRPQVDASMDTELRQQRFTLSLITLAAKLMQADGAPGHEEMLAFRALFPQPKDAHEKSARLFAKASNCPLPPTQNARDIARLFPRGDVALEELMERLFRIATADAALNEAEIIFLKKVGAELGFGASQMKAFIARHHVVGNDNPYKMLGVSPKASDEELRLAWRAQVRASHPDLMHNGSARAGHRAIAEARLAAINAAYDTVQRQRERKKAA